nr:MAG TPA: hypothetical protein [Caudoviricetes sp.]
MIELKAEGFWFNTKLFLTLNSISNIFDWFFTAILHRRLPQLG